VANAGQPLRFYRNEQANLNRWIGFDLVGRTGPRDPFGARVTVVLKSGKRLTRELEPANGFLSQSDWRLHFGLGPDSEVNQVIIRWPGGRRQELRALAAGRYHEIFEPSDAYGTTN